MTDKPPQEAIDDAITAANWSPCAKSKRGVAIFRHFPSDHVGVSIVISSAYNGPPSNYGCDGSEECRAACARRCVHAEVRAIREAQYNDGLSRCDAVHVKVINGTLVAGGGPSCAECAREVLDVGLSGFWLYEGRKDAASGLWVRYTAEEFHRASLQAAGLPAFK